MKKSKKEAELGAVVTKPASSIANKTGSWRTLKPISLKNKCTACGTCTKFCHDGAINIINGKMKIDYDFCKGCGICALECPAKAVIMKKEEK